MAQLDDADASRSDNPDASVDAGQGSSARVTASDLVDGRVMLTVEGELDLSSEAPVRVAVDQAIEGGARNIVFDLSGLTFMDSSGLAILLDAAARLDSVAVRDPSPMVRRVIELSGVGDVLRMTS